jgi:AcrR family transcriptional regulator
MEKLLEQSIWIQHADLFERDPYLSDNGRRLIANAARMIADEGLDAFTLKKLAQECGVTEPTVYRYFNNKILLCAYLCSIHWTWRQWQVVIATSNLKSGKKKLMKVAEIFLADLSNEGVLQGIKCKYLTRIVEREWTRLLHPLHYKPAITITFDQLVERLYILVREANPNFAFHKDFAFMLPELCFYNYPSAGSASSVRRHSLKFINHLIDQL